MKKYFVFIIFLCVSTVFANFDQTSSSRISYNCDNQTLTISFILGVHSPVLSYYSIVGPGTVTIPAVATPNGSNAAINFSVPNCPNLCRQSITPAGILTPSAGGVARVVDNTTNPQTVVANNIQWVPIPSARQCICPVGTFWCEDQKKCNAGGETCGTSNCVNDNICSSNESCQCRDCVNGGLDDKARCGIIDGKQTFCSDDDFTDNKPGACCHASSQWNSMSGSCVQCTSTQAPSELKAGIDQPYITCTGNGDATKTYFKYRLTQKGGIMSPFISEAYTLGKQILHPSLPVGMYTVECFYGTAANIDTSSTDQPHLCTKTITVNTNAQGCSRIYAYQGSTLSDNMASETAFDASFRCGHRLQSAVVQTNPYLLYNGTQVIPLPYDSLVSELFNGLAVGPLSLQTQNINFSTGIREVRCASKVGGGYSTNNFCSLNVCSGPDCDLPLGTFSLIHSDDASCTNNPQDDYFIGCNPNASNEIRNKCIGWLRKAVEESSRDVEDGVEFDVDFSFDGTQTTSIKCIKYAAGKMPAGLNVLDNIACRATLNNGEEFTLFSADSGAIDGSLQMTTKTVKFDTEVPVISDIKYFKDNSLTEEIPNNYWYNKPVTAMVVCSDTPTDEATSCACSQTVHSSTTDASLWSAGVPNNIVGADVMRYIRTLSGTLTGSQKVTVSDSAGNISSSQTFATNFLDLSLPVATITDSGSGVLRTMQLTVTDGESRLWKGFTVPADAQNQNGILYRIGSRTDREGLMFDENCDTTNTAHRTTTETQSGSFSSQETLTKSINIYTQVLTYCTRDNAGNTLRGVYPVINSGCFSVSNMSPLPRIDTYHSALLTRLKDNNLNDNQKYGYSFSENSSDVSCFRSILANNITTLLANQLTSKNETILDNWDMDRALVKNTNTLNTSGYYYYIYLTANTLEVTTSPTGTGIKSVVVEGGDIRIKTDLNYTGTGKTLLLIARKNNAGQGGNIIVDSNVKRIDALLIADGGALKSSDASTPGERLTINGRLYSYNTRGGSLVASGSDLIDSTTPKKFTNNTLTYTNIFEDSRNQDLERLRPMFSDSSNTCSLHINYQSFTPSALPPLLKRPTGFTGGGCN